MISQCYCFCIGLIRFIILPINSLLISLFIEKIIQSNVDMKLLYYCLILIVLNYLISLIHDNKVHQLLYYSKNDYMDKLFKRRKSNNINPKRNYGILEKDIEIIIKYKFECIPKLIINTNLIIFLLIFMINRNHYFTIIIVIVTLCKCILPLYITNLYAKYFKDTLEIEEDILNYYLTIFSRYKKSWFFSNEYFAKRLDEKNKNYYNIGIYSEKLSQFENAILNFIAVVSKFGLIFIGIILIKNNIISFSIMVALVYLSETLGSLLMEIMYSIRSYIQYKVSNERYYNELKKEEYKIKQLKEYEILSICNYEIPYLKKKINHISKSNIILIKGYNGSGKSTLLKSILNINTDYSGSILFDEQQSKYLSFDELVFYIPQNFYSGEILVKDLLNCYSHDLVQKYFERYKLDLLLLNRKIDQISSGQQEKIFIVCAFLSRKYLLMFDEPETSLDEDSIITFIEDISLYSGKVIVASNSSIYNNIADEVIET